MTSIDVRTNTGCSNAVGAENERRKAVLFCPVCGHESPVDGDWNVTDEVAVESLVCPVCDETIATR